MYINNASFVIFNFVGLTFYQLGLYIRPDIKYKTCVTKCFANVVFILHNRGRLLVDMLFGYGLVHLSTAEN